VVQATPEILRAFSAHHDKGLEQLVEYSGADSAINDECDVFFEELITKGDCGCFEFDGLYWSKTVERLAATGRNIGLYLHSWSEYGSQFFLAKNPSGEFFSFFAGGPDDDFELEGGDVVSDENVEKWLAVIPVSIKKAFPQLLEISS